MTDAQKPSRWMFYAPYLFGPLSIAEALAAGNIALRLGGGIDAIFFATAGGLSLNFIGLAWQALRLAQQIKRRRAVNAQPSVDVAE
jgi:hypothetical protein